MKQDFAHFDIVCLSHLRWDFVYQRPQHLMKRFARNHRIFFYEEPVFDNGVARLEVLLRGNVTVLVPHLPEGTDPAEVESQLQQFLGCFMAENRVRDYILWYYTPMALGFTRFLHPRAVIYDCMDELSAFDFAPAELSAREVELLQRAGLVFTGGQSLYESKRNQHPAVHAFPSSVDVEHFAQARALREDPADQAAIPHPRIGFYGVLDERLDIALLDALAQTHPDWQFVMVGPVVKIDERSLPCSPNVHYLGAKGYDELPAYLGGWDVAILPFAINRATRFISPTKTPEYLAGGKPVVSSPIRDVVHPYGKLGLVHIAGNVQEWSEAIEQALHEEHDQARVDAFLRDMSWDRTQGHMEAMIGGLLEREEAMTGEPVDAPVEMLARETRPIPGARSHEFDYLIVGAGFAGSVLAERLARIADKKVLLVDRRNHIAGNAYDRYDDAGILIHQYGPHIFHTNSERVFNYLSQFTAWRHYQHRVRASVDGQLLPIPINLDTVNELYGLDLNAFQVAEFFQSVAEPRDQILTSEDVVVSAVGRDLYEKFFRGYTRKQWGLDPSELDAGVTARVPTRTNRDDRYFGDSYQAMPLHGYTRLFERMLDHPNITLMLNTDYRDVASWVPYRHLIYTGPIDEYFDYRFGKLPYRSLRFDFQTHRSERYQQFPVVNYPNDYQFTRITEFKYLTGQEHPATTIVMEYPEEQGDPYYPIPRPENDALYKRYKALADASSGVTFAGRLATYKYYNMDQVVAQALATFERLIRQEESVAGDVAGAVSSVGRRAW